jgi:hypothetical protein
MHNETKIFNPTFRENYHSDMRRFHNYRETLTTEGIFKPTEPAPIKIETKYTIADFLKRLEINLAKNDPFKFKIKKFYNINYLFTMRPEMLIAE